MSAEWLNTRASQQMALAMIYYIVCKEKWAANVVVEWHSMFDLVSVCLSNNKFYF